MKKNTDNGKDYQKAGRIEYIPSIIDSPGSLNDLNFQKTIHTEKKQKKFIEKSKVQVNPMISPKPS